MRIKIPHEPAGIHIQAANALIDEVRAAFAANQQRRPVQVQRQKERREALGFWAFCLVGCGIYYLFLWMLQ